MPRGIAVRILKSLAGLEVFHFLRSKYHPQRSLRGRLLFLTAINCVVQNVRGLDNMELLPRFTTNISSNILSARAER